MPLDKKQLFTALKSDIENILSSQQTSEEYLNKVCILLQNRVPYYDWVGFYFGQIETQKLYLKAFAGMPTEHAQISFGQGICGQVAVSNQNFLVPDVQAQDNYIACSFDVKSEIVVPLFKNGQNIGQIDIDSHTKNPFSDEDIVFLEWLNKKIAETLT